jgi:hypothetical protein
VARARVHLIVNVGYQIDGPDQIGEGVRPASNIVCWFIDERPRPDPVRGRCSGGGRSGLKAGRHGHTLEMGDLVATVLHLLQGFFLWLQNDVGNSSY